MLYFGSVVVALMTLVILLVGHRQWRSALYQTEMRGVVIANSVAGLASNALLKYDYPTLQNAADEIQAETQVAHVIILDKEYVVAGYSGRPELQGQRLDDPISTRIVESAGTLIQRFAPENSEGHENRTFLDVAVPVRVKGSSARWGTVRVGMSLDAMQTELSGTQRDLILLAMAAVMLVLLSARYFTSKITEPLGELAEATRVVASGRLDHVVNEDLVGELGETARSFNKMTVDLRRSRDAVRYQNQHLENMVQERTAALREKARELEKANQELKVVDRLKSDFLSNVSHELRTPLTSIRSFTEILLDDGMDLEEAERQEFLQIVASQAERLSRLINDLLDLSKIEAGEFHCAAETIALDHKVIHPSIETLKTIARERNVEIITRLGDPLPPVLGDGDRMSQVLTNLVDNALKFTPAGGEIHVSTELSDTRVNLRDPQTRFAGLESDTPELGPYVVVHVEDTGVGIDRADRQRIFEKFGQVGNVLTSKPQGTGLGLAISGSIMVQHGGAIWVESETGRGSRFSFSIPVSMEAAETSRREERPSGRGRQIDTGDLVAAVQRMASGNRILVIDDDYRVLEAINAGLEPHGYRVLGCQGGSQAIAQVRDLRPDLIILDTMMPGISGYDLLRTLKSDPKLVDIPVVVMGSSDEDQGACDLGAVYHVRKSTTGRDESKETMEPVA
jgi:signal transduction histidine kinase